MTRRAELRLTSATPVTPHKPAAWTILGEWLRELAGVRQRLAAFAAPLGQLVPPTGSRVAAGPPKAGWPPQPSSPVPAGAVR